LDEGLEVEIVLDETIHLLQVSPKSLKGLLDLTDIVGVMCCPVDQGVKDMGNNPSHLSLHLKHPQFVCQI
jgi:hypothetical protein